MTEESPSFFSREVLSAVALVITIAATFTMQIWIWKFGFYKDIKAQIKNLEGNSIKVKYNGKYSGFARANSNNGFITAFNRAKWLRDRIGDGLNELMKLCVTAAVVQILLLGVWIVTMAEGKETKNSSALLFFIPWSEMVSLIFFVILSVNVYSEWCRIKEELPPKLRR